MKAVYEQYTTTGIRALAVCGAVAILVLAGFGIARTVPLFSELAANAVQFSKQFFPAEHLTFTPAEGTVASGASIVFTYTHENKEANGAYVISYPCDTGIAIAQQENSEERTALACGTNTAVSTGSPLTLSFTSSNAVPVNVPVTLAFLPDAADQPSVSDTATVLVTPEETSGNGGTSGDPGDHNNGSDGNGAADPTPAPSGPADLAVTVLGLGYIENGTFTQNKTSDATNRRAVRFSVENTGGRTSLQWHFTAELPTNPAHTFTSKSQQRLAPGDRIEFTLGFDQIRENDRTLVITIDPENAIPDADRGNNTIAVTIPK